MVTQSPLMIYIIPDGRALFELDDYKANKVGRAITTGKDLVFNKVDGGFSLIFPGKLLKALDPNYLISNVVRVFCENLPGFIPGITIEYLYELRNEDEDDAFDVGIAEAILALDVRFHQIMETWQKKHMIRQFRYKRSESVIDTAEYYSIIMNGDDDGEDDGDGEEEYLGTTQWDNWDDSVKTLDQVMRGYDPGDDEDEDEEEEEDYPKRRRRKRKTKRKDGYSASAVLKACRNPKRAFNRHGVLVVKSEKPIKKDRKTIKEFLEDFIPGNASWKKKLRRELADRWMQVYALTTKQLKKLEKAHRKTRNDKYRIHVDDNQAVDFTRRLFTSPLDNWNNPNK